MKKELIFAAATTLSLFSAACNDIGGSSSVPEIRGMMLSAQHDGITRTHFDGTTTAWSDGDAITVFVDENFSIPYRFETVDPAKGTFRNGDITLTDDVEYTFHAVYPAVTDAKILDIGAASQTQNGVSAEHIAASDPLVGKTVARPSEAAVTMEHAATVLKLTVVRSGTLDIDNIVSVKIEAPDGVFLYGKHSFDLASGNITPITGRCGNTIEVKVTDSGDFAVGGGFEVWAAAAPFGIPSGEKLTFTVTDGNGGMYRIDKAFPDGKEFKAGRIMATVLELSESVQLDEINIGVDFTDPDAYPQGFPTESDKVSSGTFMFSGQVFGFESTSPFCNRGMSDGKRALCFENFAKNDNASIRIPRIMGYAPDIVRIGVHSTITGKQKAKIAIKTSDKEITDRVYTNKSSIEYQLSGTDDDTDYYIGIYGEISPCRLSSIDIVYKRIP